MGWDRKFRWLSSRYRRPDGRPWSGAEIERRTGGFVSRSYLSKLRTGHIQDPSFERIAAISRVMGIPLAEWDREPDAPPPSNP